MEERFQGIGLRGFRVAVLRKWVKSPDPPSMGAGL